MTEPHEQDRIDMLKGLRRTRRTAFAVLAAEALAACLWRPVAWFGFFAGLWMLQIPAVFGTPGALAALAVFAAGMVFLVRRDMAAMRWPDADAVDRRLEQANGLRHRPLATLGDRLANPRKPETYLLWQSNKSLAQAAVRKLRMSWPRPVVAARDPAALRILAILTFFMGWTIAGPQAGERIGAGLFPWHASVAHQKTQDVSLWITPPAYTGRQTIIIAGGRVKKPIEIPAGSMVKARVSRGFGHPVLATGDARVPFKKMDDGNWGVETAIMPGNRLIISQGFFHRADIAYNYMTDKPPSITVKDKPEVLKAGQWRFNVSVQDDYGVTDLILHMKLDPRVTSAPLGKPVDVSRPIMTPGGDAVTLKPVYDMTWHTWAGLPVVVTLEAKDHNGQSAMSKPFNLPLPEHPFRHPVAVSLIEQRHELAWAPDKAALQVGMKLEKILGDVGSYRGSIPVFLSLRSAASHLMYDPTAESAAMVIPQLWDTALTIEEGNMPLAARDLRQAQEDLQKLLNDPKATPEQIATAMEKLRTAMGQYLTEAFRNLQRNMVASGLPPLTNDQINQILRPEDIEAFLDQLQAQALTGDKDAARDMLSQLQKMTDAMDPSQAPDLPKDMQFMADAMREIQNLTEAQKNLAADTAKDKSAANSAKGRKTQDGLVTRLESLMSKADDAMGQIPKNMQDADKAMRGSVDALKAGDADKSLPFQKDAIEQLQKGQDEMREQFRQRMKQMMMMALGGGQLDPLGHPTGEGNTPGIFSGSKVKIPDQGQRKQVQDIMHILRQRSGERSRPDYELEYYRRLMRQF